jgi:hypothetical protein
MRRAVREVLQEAYEIEVMRTAGDNRGEFARDLERREQP